MKKLIFLLATVFMFACQKQNEVQPQPQPIAPAVTGNVVFYSPDTLWLWGVRVDGVDLDTVFRSYQAPACGDPFFQNVTLQTGQHIVEVYSLSGLFDHWPDTIQVQAGSCLVIAVQ